ncbi:MAG: methionyl aminopeptidase [Actinomycetota bacterium]|jgi:methionyl aminopeptidase|nr:methionyl aminopeptidase [Actinomycetota bacterium]
MIEIRTPAEVEEMRPAGAFVASVVEATAAASAVGVNLLALDRIAGDMIKRAGAKSSYVDYHPSFGASPFGKFICLSVNDAALHGLPFDYKLRDGDVLSLDFAASVNGWVADSARTVIVGTPRPDDVRLVDVTRRALEAGIAEARPGNRMGDISAAIGTVAHEAGLSVNLEFGGHGVGREMHGDPHVPNDGRAKRGLPLRAGLVFAIEPWFMLGTDRIYTDRDGWTLRSADGSRAAHFEHTIAITDRDPLVLTRPSTAPPA